MSARLSDIHRQSAVVRSLSAFAAAPYSNAFIFAGSSGVGKTAAAWALANELGCDPDWGGVVEIPSGTQDGRAVEDLLRRMHLRPLGGSGWKVVIINEADRMTPQAEVMWLDGLEKLPSKTVVVFTTNNLHKLTDRFVRRCEVQRFDATSDEFRDGIQCAGFVGLQALDRLAVSGCDTRPVHGGQGLRRGNRRRLPSGFRSTRRCTGYRQ